VNNLPALELAGVDLAMAQHVSAASSFAHGMRVRPRSARGRPKPRPQVPMYDCQAFRKGLFQHVEANGCDKAFSWGVYANTPVSHGVKGSGIAKLVPLLDVLVEVSPFMMFYFKDILQANTLIKPV
jgi:hypothetical protein